MQFGPSIGGTLTEHEIARYLYSETGEHRQIQGNEVIGHQIASVTKVVTALQTAARLTAIGVSYTEYPRFRALTPHRNDYFGSRRTYDAPSNYAPTEENVTFCIQFVVTAALRLATAEAQLVEPPWIGGAQARWEPWETLKEIHDGDLMGQA